MTFFALQQLMAVFFLSLHLAKSVSSFSVKKPLAAIAPAALVFCHGLGNSAKTCKPSIQDCLLQLDPSLSDTIKEFVFPAAARHHSTINGGKSLPSWFHLYDWHVGLSARDDREGILRAVDQIRTEIEKLEAEQGIPQSRIALSGWLALRDDLHCTQEARQTPLFWGHGRRDKNVRPEQQFFGVKKLMQQGVRSTTTKSYEMMGHEVSTEELCDIVDFLKRVLPEPNEQQGTCSVAVEYLILSRSREELVVTR
jgi:predicted esterase